ncbi:MAG TPA: 1,4-dihydroxy-2-naphthoate polyprenyltransferase, partial [Deltaproteobacteria bacterium]|nr:1,4-dihydroxy-2-naphthoate polyprenyltransferase [Deltaproteobacteria bacterium]
TLPSLAWIVSIPVGSLATAILVVNNLRDIETDRRAGKRTLAVRTGRRGARLEWVALVAGAYCVTFVAWLGWDASVWVLLPWATLPMAISIGRRVLAETSGPALNGALAATARLGVFFSALLALGLIA